MYQDAMLFMCQYKSYFKSGNLLYSIQKLATSGVMYPVFHLPLPVPTNLPLVYRNVEESFGDTNGLHLMA